jgi:acyl-coenzyme A thioesterase PaaI-like protein
VKIPPHHDPNCWGCGHNPNGIRLPIPEAEGATQYEASFSFDERHQGGPGLVHGGLVSAALDEACGLLASWHRFPCVTARIFVRYRRPVHINRMLVARAWVTGTHTRRIHVDGELREGEEILAEARAAFVHVPLEHFLRTPEGRAAGEAWRERLG